MLAWVVMIRGHARQAARKSPSLLTQRLCVKLSDPLPPAFPLVSSLPYLLPSSVSRNSFVCRSYENCRGVYPKFPFWNSPITTPVSSHVGLSLPPIPHSLHPIPFLLTLLRTLLRFFALSKITTLFFSSDYALFDQTLGGTYLPLPVHSFQR